jgi:ribosomal protein L21
MYAIIKTGGKQYKVSQGDILNVDKCKFWLQYLLSN